MKTSPFGISVVIPTFNRHEALLRAISSVRTKNAAQCEIIVVDDCSAQDPGEYLPTMNEDGVPIRCFRLVRNGGPQGARNLGIRRAKFEFIALLDSDDTFMPEKVDVLLSEMGGDDTDLLFHDTEGMDRYNRMARFWQSDNKRHFPVRLALSFYNPAPTPAIAFRRQCCLGVPGMRHCEDYAFLLHYCSVGVRARYIPRPLCAVHRAQRSSGGLSQSVWRMRMGEFRARRIMLKHGTPVDYLRFLVGTSMGLMRVANDVIRLRYI